MQQPPRSSLLGTITGLGLVVLAVGLYFNQNLVRDTISASLFKPSQSIEKVNQKIGLTTTGQRFFYASKPELSTADEFNAKCRDIEKTSVVLGCYDGNTITLYDINNQELEGIEEVTAAHEMLHAAYDRLDKKSKLQLDKTLEEFGDELQSDPRFAERISVYNNLSQAQRTNELHSILGTEVDKLNQELESHYSQYFKDRKTIVGLYKNYSGVFNKLRNDAEELAANLDRQAANINNQTSSYKIAVSVLNRDTTDFNKQASKASFGTQVEFNEARQALLARSSALDSQLIYINKLIDKYNQDRKQLDGVADHLTTLNNSIDSRPPAIEEVR